MTCQEEAPAAVATRGQMAATHAVESDGDALNRPAGVDTLRDAIQAVVDAGDPALLRAFARRLQKALERVAAIA